MSKDDLREENRFVFRGNKPASREEHALIARNECSIAINRDQAQGDRQRRQPAHQEVGERLTEWVRRDVGIADPNVEPNHAWRHLFKTSGRRKARGGRGRSALEREAGENRQGEAEAGETRVSDTEEYRGYRLEYRKGGRVVDVRKPGYMLALACFEGAQPNPREDARRKAML
jgi:hypothetical protein